jgi:hypothetical protein
MKKIFATAVSLLLIQAHSQSVVNTGGRGSTSIDRNVIDKRKKVEIQKRSILIIGNEFSAANSMQQLTQYISAQHVKPYKVTSGSIFGKNYSFKDHLEKSPLKESFKEIQWDYVILQGHAEMALQSPDAYKSNAASLIQNLKQFKTKIILLMPPAKTGTAVDTQTLLKLHLEIAKENNSVLSPVGSAFTLAKKNEARLKLFLADNSTPSPHGSYLTAAVLSHTLTGQSCIGQKQLGLKSITQAEGLYLQKVSTKIMKDYINYLKRQNLK